MPGQKEWFASVYHCLNVTNVIYYIEGARKSKNYMIRIKRAYDDIAPEDGKRYLVDRLWPRGIKKEDLKIEKWVRGVAPSNELRKWYAHEPEKWEVFRKKYEMELENDPENWIFLLNQAKKYDITLIYSAKNRDINNAVVLKEFLDGKIHN